MTCKEIMTELAMVRNALFHMAVCGEQTFVVSACIQKLDSVLKTLNQHGPDENVPPSHG